MNWWVIDFLYQVLTLASLYQFSSQLHTFRKDKERTTSLAQKHLLLNAFIKLCLYY
uniref:Uncharacterized protein n=1 Tax=Arundo donax TaxID=35708 RepID=A0A0A9ALJ7_ARUDO